MNQITLSDGTPLALLDPQEKAAIEKEMGELLAKHNAVVIPTLHKDISSLSASISIYKKVSKEEVKNNEEPDTKTEEGSESNSA